MSDKLIIGCGYLGRRVAKQWQQQGQQVHVLTRSPTRRDEFAAMGLTPLVGDVTSLDDAFEFPAVETCLYAIGYDRSAGIDKRTVTVDGLKRVLEKLQGKVQRLIFISSSSVYGHEDGSLVDEESDTTPATEGGQITLEAEEVVKQLNPADGNWTILRLSGIYGPGRLLMKADHLKSGQPLGGEPDAWLNIIHVDDAADVVLTAEQHAKPGSIYLITDDAPVPRYEYYGELSRMIAAPPPMFDTTGPAGRTRGLNKRLSNAKMKRELGVTLRYPTFREGLFQMVAGVD